MILPVLAPVMETTDNGEIGYSVYKGETREKTRSAARSGIRQRHGRLHCYHTG